MSAMDPKIRQKLTDLLVEYHLSVSFGDGLEVEYLLNGTTFVGFNNMTDEELLSEAEQLFAEEKDDPLYEVWLQANESMGIIVTEVDDDGEVKP